MTRVSFQLIAVTLSLFPVISLLAQAPSSRVSTFDRYDPTLLSYEVSGVEGESIDPRTLHVSWEVTDLTIPGNGGLDISVSRSFGKLAHTPSDMGHWYMGVPRIQLPASPWRGPIDPAAVLNDTFSAAWYNLHARLNSGTSSICESAGYLVDPYFTTSISVQQVPGIMYAAPITLYIPGEGTKLLIEKLPQATHFPADATYVTTDNWYARCIQPDQYRIWGGFEVFSPTGTRYVFDFIQYMVPGDYALGTNGGWVEMGISFIEDVHGNWLYYDYDLGQGGNDLLKQIEANDGRLVEYEWHPDSVLGVDVQGSPLSLLSKVHYTLSGQRQSIEYAYCDFADVYILKVGCNPVSLEVDGDLPVLAEVRLANGFTTQYSYNGDMYSANVFLDWGGFEFLLEQVTLPTGGAIQYEYQPGFSPIFANTDSPAPRLMRRTTSGEDVDTGIWNYTYSLAGHIETTTMATSGRKDIYEFYEGVGTYEFQIAYREGDYSWPNYAPYDFDEIMGHLRSHKIKAGWKLLQQTDYEYGLASYLGKQWYGGNWLGFPTLVLAQVRPLPVTLTTVTDHQSGGLQYTTATPLAEFDTYMQPLAVYETGHDGSIDGESLNRATHYTWHNTSSPWLIGLPDRIVRGQYVVDYDYESGSSLISRADNYGIVNDFSYNADGTLSSKRWIRDGIGYVSHYRNYYLGVPRYEEHPLDPVAGETVVLRRGVNELGRILWEEDANRNRTGFNYDASGLLVGLNPPLSEPMSVGYIVQSGVLESLLKSQGSRTQTLHLDAFGREAVSIDRGSSLRGMLEVGALSRYDGQGRKNFESFPFNWTGAAAEANAEGLSYSYDAFDRVVLRTSSADGGQLQYCYAQVCNTGEYAQVFDSTLENGVVITDERGYQTAYEHRAFGHPENIELTRVVQQISKVAEPGGARFAVTRLNRDAWGHITSVSQGDGLGAPVARHYRYDERQLLIEEEHPETGITRHSYDESGNRTLSVLADNFFIFSDYDGMNRLLTVNYPGEAPDISNQWSPTGAITAIDNTSAAWRYGYDAEERLTVETLTAGDVTIGFHYGYNSLGHRSEIIYPDGQRFALDPDDFGRPQQFGDVVFDIGYHPDGTVSRLEYANGFEMQLPKTQAMMPAGRLLKDSGGETLLQLDFAYDLAANLVSISDAGGWQHARALGYDGLGRLTHANGYWGQGTLEYDAVGNLAKKQIGSSQLSYQYDATNRLRSLNGLRYRYDLMGNVKSDGISNYSFNTVSQLISSDAQTGVTYAYDGNGRRTQLNSADGKQIDFYDQAGQLVYSDQCELDGITINYYHLGNELVAREEQPCDGSCH